MSPFSFVIVMVLMEALSIMLFATVNGVFSHAFSMGYRHSGVVNISQMLFADDTIVFCAANPNHLRYLHVVFLSPNLFPVGK